MKSKLRNIENPCKMPDHIQEKRHFDAVGDRAEKNVQEWASWKRTCPSTGTALQNYSHIWDKKES